MTVLRARHGLVAGCARKSFKLAHREAPIAAMPPADAGEPAPPREISRRGIHSEDTSADPTLPVMDESSGFPAEPCGCPASGPVLPDYAEVPLSRLVARARVCRVWQMPRSSQERLLSERNSVVLHRLALPFGQAYSLPPPAGAPSSGRCCPGYGSTERFRRSQPRARWSALPFRSCRAPLALVSTPWWKPCFGTAWLLTSAVTCLAASPGRRRVRDLPRSACGPGPRPAPPW